MDKLKYKDSSDLIIKAFFRVYNTLGHGFLEKVYENALVIEAGRLGLRIKQQMPISVLYGEAIVGEYTADLAVNDIIIVERKVACKLATEHEAQLMNYLKATPYEIGLLLNFGVNTPPAEQVASGSLPKGGKRLKP